jgi:outer membrane protein TolC
MPLTLREAVSLSLNHNLDLEVARYQPWIEDQNVLAALGPWDHTAYAGASGQETSRPGFSALFEAPEVQNSTAEFTMGLRKTLPFGASFDLSLSSQRQSSNQPFLLLDPYWTGRAGAAVTVPVLRGASVAANTATLVVARNARDGSVDQFEKTLADSVFQVMRAYWGLVFAIENRKVKEQSVDLTRRLLEDNRRKFERGVAARIEVTRSESSLAAQLEGILTAEANVQNAMDVLKRLIDPSLLREEVVLDPVDSPRRPEGEIDEREAEAAAMARALERRPEFRQSDRDLDSQQATLAKARNDLLPRLDLTGHAYLQGLDDSFSGTARQADGLDYRDLSVGVVFEYPLERSAARGAAQRAELERRRIRLQRKNLENQVLVEVREAVRSIKTDEKRVEAGLRARLLAREELEGEMTRREQGLSTTVRVLEAQEDLAQARTNELKALIDCSLNFHRLDQVTGTLLEKNGIVLRENLLPRMSDAGR